MKNSKAIFELIRSDRSLVIALLLNMLAGIVSIIVIAATIQPKETQVITKYTSYGDIGLYRDYWYMLWAYVVLELMIVFGHGILSLKLVKVGYRSLALAFLWLSLGMIILVCLFARGIIKIASIG